MELTIVHDEKTCEITQQINAIISSIPEYDSCVFTENDWKDNKAKISSENYVLFIGNVKDGIALKPIMKWQYEKINMKYGWIGKQGLLLVEKHKFTSDEIKELKNMFHEQKIHKLNAGATAGIMTGAAILLGLIGIAITSTVLAIINKKEADKIYLAEYGYMINLLFDSKRIDFDKFMGIEDKETTELIQ